MTRCRITCCALGLAVFAASTALADGRLLVLAKEFANLPAPTLKAATGSSGAATVRERVAAPADVLSAGNPGGTDEGSDEGGLRADPCQDSLWNNGAYDETNGFANLRGPNLDRRVADDATFDTSVQIQGIKWYTVDDSAFTWNSKLDIQVLANDGTGGAPKSVVKDLKDVTGGKRTDTGKDLFGRNVYLYEKTGLTIDLGSGTYFFNARPITTKANPQSFWLSAPLANSTAYQIIVDGGGDWTALDSDVSFCLLGITTTTGACCFSDGTCQQLTKSKCTTAGGTYQGDNTTCVPNTCPGAPGACCFESGACTFVVETDCTGIFQGEGVPCTGGLCPIPDVCADAIYNNSSYDAINALTSERDDTTGIESYTADDVAFTKDAKVTGVNFYCLTQDAYGFTGNGDVIVVLADGAGGAPLTTQTELLDQPTDAAQTADVIFGLPVWLYMMNNLNIDLSAGTYWFGMRPVGGGSGRNFWLTAGLTGQTAYLRGAFFGYPDWTSWEIVGGSATDVAFCVDGTFSGATKGACCFNDGQGTCEILTKTQCTSAKGSYQGDGTSCVPNTCPGAPGACCLEDGSCTYVLPTDCSGDFKGSGVVCVGGLCPIPEPCPDSQYNNNVWDGTNALTCERSQLLSSYTVDDAPFSDPVKITGAGWYATTDATYLWTGNADVLVLTNSGTGGAPGTTVVELLDQPATALDTLYQLFGSPLFLYKVEGLSITLAPGTYYFGLRPVGDGAEGRNFWATAVPTGGESYLKSADFGYNDWTAWSGLLGAPADVAFCLNGVVTQATGACCFSSTCKQLTKSECSTQKGTYKGDGTSCFPNPCPDAPGACCFADGTCEFLKPSECKTKSGTFQGADIPCSVGLCPIPDPCVEAVYNNGPVDGLNALSSERADQSAIESWTADDFSLTAKATISGVHFSAITTDEYQWDNSADVLVMKSNSGVPGDTVVELSQQASTRIQTAILFGLPLYLYHVEDLSIQLDAGNYFLGARPYGLGGPDLARSFWASAAVTGSGGAFFKSDYFGFADWTPWVDVAGADYDVSFCLVAGGAPCAGFVRGDANGDGLVDFDDIDCFVAALIGQDSWLACGTKYGAPGYTCANDINKDGSVDFDDIDGFVTCIINGGCP